MAYNLIEAVKQGAIEHQQQQQTDHAVPREWIDSVAVIHTHPKHGTFRIVINDEDRIHLEAIEPIDVMPGQDWHDVYNKTQRRPLVIRGVAYNASFSLIWNPDPVTHYGDGSPYTPPIDSGWRVTPGNYDDQDKKHPTPINWGWRTGFYGSRAGGYKYDDTTPAGKRGLIEIAEQVAADWYATAGAKAELLRGAIASASQSARSLEEEIQKMEQQIDSARGKVAILDTQIAEHRIGLEYQERRTAANAATRAGR